MALRSTRKKHAEQVVTVATPSGASLVHHGTPSRRERRQAQSAAAHERLRWFVVGASCLLAPFVAALIVLAWVG